ncbi:MAG: sel1 repeat family protein [Alphaproteobacteria bacterium]|nr:MAG: sel1 repeat family protein [Alphaproteobacteria bacterium]
MAQVDTRYLQDRIQAAEAGEPNALYDLGLLYSTGQGVNLDYVQAHKWFNLAALRGVRRAQVDRTELAREMSPIEIAEAQRQAREWMSSH